MKHNLPTIKASNKAYNMKRIISLCFITLMACSHNDRTLSTRPDIANVETSENASSDKDTLENYLDIKKAQRPKSEFEIAGGGIGNLYIGAPFKSIDDMYAKVDTLTTINEGGGYPAKRIDLGNGEWILAETDIEDGLIIRLHTNSKKYKTPSGFHVGQKFSDLINAGEEIGLSIEEGYLSLEHYKDNIVIDIDSLSENAFYKSKNQTLNDIPKNARIAGFGVY